MLAFNGGRQSVQSTGSTNWQTLSHTLNYLLLSAQKKVLTEKKNQYIMRTLR